MRILILGGDGMLGHRLFKSLRPRHDARVTLHHLLESYESSACFVRRIPMQAGCHTHRVSPGRSGGLPAAGGGECNRHHQAAGRIFGEHPEPGDQRLVSPPPLPVVPHDRCAPHPLEYGLRVFRTKGKLRGDRPLRCRGPVRPQQVPRRGPRRPLPDDPDVHDRPRAGPEAEPPGMVSCEDGNGARLSESHFLGVYNAGTGRIIERMIVEYRALRACITSPAIRSANRSPRSASERCSVRFRLCPTTPCYRTGLDSSRFREGVPL